MAIPAVEQEQAKHPRCWCCGKTFVKESELTRLGDHPEVAVCARDVRPLAASMRPVGG